MKTIFGIIVLVAVVVWYNSPAGQGSHYLIGLIGQYIVYVFSLAWKELTFILGGR